MSRLYGRVAGIALMGLMAWATSGCDSFLDVNENPNSPESVRMELTFPGVLMMHTSEMAEYHYAGWTSQWMKQFAWNAGNYGYSQRQRYEMTAIDSDGPWGSPYTNTGQECVNIMKATESTGETYYHGIAKLILAWKGAQLSDAWGPIPWSEAFDTEIRDPVYDTQQEVYTSIQQMLTEAISEMQTAPADPTARVPGENDLLYGGDMSKWVKLGHMLQARFHMRIAYAPGENPQQRAQSALDALAQGFASNADDALMEYTGGSGARQPRYGGSAANGDYGDGGWDHANTASAYFIDLLKGLNDPRMPIMFTPALEDGEFRGHVNGEPGVADSLISHISEAIWGETVPYPWFTYAEGKFIEAEARLIVSGAGAADAPYRAGIRANMESYGVASGDIDSYLAALPSLASEAKPLEAIITQKYIADYLTGEAWNDWRRTGYPVLTPVTNEPYLPEIPQRFRTPAREVTYNADNVLATGIPQGLEGMLTKVWWATGSPTVQ